MIMKNKKIYTIILLAVSSLILLWTVPAMVRMATASSQNYPFVYYSSIAQRFIIREFGEGTKFTHLDTQGNHYTREQFDSLTPLLSYRQLMLDGTMPDTIMGVAMEPRLLMSKSVVWKYSPRDMHAPVLKLYLMYESMSGRTNLESPDDVFRFADKIEFIDKLTNTVNTEKSERFQKKLEEEHFAFPAQQVWGNLSARKPYDEGYFVLDNNRQLFHVKMVNGRPYVRNTKAGESIDIAYFGIKEVADRSIYGFIVSRDGAIYTLNEGYGLTKFDLPNIDIDKHSVMLMANLFYWMVNVTTPESCTYNVLEAGTLKQHDTPYAVAAVSDKWEKTSAWLFPVYISLANPHTDYIVPVVKCNAGKAFFISFALAIVYLFTFGRKRTATQRITASVLIALLGIPAFIASLIFK